MGLVHGAGRRTRSQGQAHRRRTRQAAQLPTARAAFGALVHRAGRGRARPSTGNGSRSASAPRSTCRAASRTGSRTSARSRSCSSRSSTAATSARTTSSAWKTTSAGSDHGFGLGRRRQFGLGCGPCLRTLPSPFASCSGRPATSGSGRCIAVLANPALELVGCYAWSPDKVGRDVGELCGIAPDRRARDRRCRRAARARARLRDLQPEVARRRRARADPRIGRERRDDRGVHHRPRARRRPAADRRRVRARAERRSSGRG